MTTVLTSKRKYSEIRDAETRAHEGRGRDRTDVSTRRRPSRMANHHLKPGGRCGLDSPSESPEGTTPAHALTLGRKKKTEEKSFISTGHGGEGQQSGSPLPRRGNLLGKVSGSGTTISSLFWNSGIWMSVPPTSTQRRNPPRDRAK